MFFLPTEPVDPFEHHFLPLHAAVYMREGQRGGNMISLKIYQDPEMDKTCELHLWANIGSSYSLWPSISRGKTLIYSIQCNWFKKFLQDAEEETLPRL